MAKEDQTVNACNSGWVGKKLLNNTGVIIIIIDNITHMLTGVRILQVIAMFNF